MDKPTLIVVPTCLALLAAYWWTNRDTEEPKPQPAPQVQTAQTAPAAEQPAAAQAPAEQPAATPPAEAQAPAEQATAEQPAAPAPPVQPEPETYTLTACNNDGKPVVKYHFSTAGGALTAAEMLDTPINSTKPELQGNVFINGVAGHGIGTLMFNLQQGSEPLFDPTVYTLVKDPNFTNAKQVAMVGNINGYKVTKVFKLKEVKERDGERIEGSQYTLDLRIWVENTSGNRIAFQNCAVYAGGTTRISSAEWSSLTNFVTMEDNDFSKHTESDFSHFFGENDRNIVKMCQDPLQWAGVMNQYYASIVMPSNGTSAPGYYAAPTRYLQHGERENGFELGVCIPNFELAPKGPVAGSEKVLDFTIFTGPKYNLMLHDLDNEIRGLSNIMDFGILAFLSYPMDWMINLFHGLFGNWGWAIVAMTFVIRLLIWPLYRKSYMSMKRMSLLQPKMKELQEKYGDDRQRVSTEMMKLYREYGISPVGGCLPMLAQMPIFFAFFWVLQAAAEFRNAPWMGWVTDLSQMDTVATIPLGSWEIPVNPLPFVMVLSMVVQMRMNPTTLQDNTQKWIMRLMPIFFFAFCYLYPSALALYWTTTNVISIFQTWLIRRMPAPTLEKVKQEGKKRKKGFMERMLEAQKAALEAQQEKERMRNVTRR